MVSIGSLVWPFSIADYDCLCPRGHLVKLATGYSTFAPNWWDQVGSCKDCGRGVSRKVGVRSSEFVAGPVHWLGEETEEENNWFHDVLNQHVCRRCVELGMIKLAEIIKDGIEEGADLETIRALVLKVLEDK